MQKKLEPGDAEFFSKVRYIITKKEKKIFLELPNSEKEKFKEEFWKRRDPYPDTEENEFKMEYFNRIERADELFHGEGRPGWMTDRGRIYILFGPPRERITYPSGEDFYGRCREVWYYGGFPVVFVDRSCIGTYRLVTYDLTSLRSLNMQYMHDLAQAQADAKNTIRSKKRLFDFKWIVKKTVNEEKRVEGIIVIEIPYTMIWYKSEGDLLETILDIHLELKDFENNTVWEFKEAHEIAMKEDELEDKGRETHRIEIPFILEKDLQRLRQGKNLLHLTLINRTGDEELRKVMEFLL